MKTLHQIVQSDLYRYKGKTGSPSFFSIYLRNPGFKFTYHLRKVAYYSSKKKSLGIFAYAWHRLVLNHYRFRYGFDISPTTSIGAGFFIGHFGGIVISPHAVIGANVNVAQGVTIGATSRGRTKGVPTIEDRVWIGAHAIIVGNVTIGHDALIAPGAYVNCDVPSMAVFLGNPGKVVSSQGSIGYINNTIDELEAEVSQPPK